ncbi:MAG: A/G-specific adenine glycosylase [Pseudomonadota bacterium]|jgi:A/G-specific adenine glycosylase
MVALTRSQKPRNRPSTRQDHQGDLLKADITRDDQPGPVPTADRTTLPPPLLAWYDRHRRVLPWRAAPGERADPYRVWLSEIMLQQTTVVTVGPYFKAFTTRWPTVAHLAAADLDDVLRAWAGLGYYARARNLHACARAVSADHGGTFPQDEEGLRQLPGIGAYTAAAIAAIAFDRPAVAMDGNVERVMARLFDVRDPLPGVKPVLKDLAARLVPDRRPGDYTQALFDLGATLCTPRKPRCTACPVADLCRARAAGSAEDLPAKSAKAAKPVRRGMVFFLTDPDAAILLRRRPETGLLGGMMEFPSTAWSTSDSSRYLTIGTAEGEAPVPGVRWRSLPGMVRHTFTHFHLELQVVAGQVRAMPAPPGCRWVPLEEVSEEALPTLMRKVLDHAIRKGGIRE